MLCILHPLDFRGLGFVTFFFFFRFFFFNAMGFFFFFSRSSVKCTFFFDNLDYETGGIIFFSFLLCFFLF